MDLIGLTPSDEAALARMLAAFESGLLTRQRPSRTHESPRLFEVYRFLNSSGETAPAYGVMRLDTPVTIDGESVLVCKKPDATWRRLYLVNGTEDVANGGTGWGTLLADADWVLYDTGSTPALAEEWGPKSG